MRQEQRSKKELIMSQKQRYKDHPAGFAPVLDWSKQRGAFYLSHHQCFFLHLTLNLAYAETCYLQLVWTFCVKMQLCRLRKKKENKFFGLGKNHHHHVTTRLDTDKGYQFKGQGALQVRQYQFIIDGTCSFVVVFVVFFPFLGCCCCFCGLRGVIDR